MAEGRGRPVKGAELVNNLDGSQHAKQRAALILQTLTGAVTIPQACEQLGIGEAAFHKLRARTLQEMVEGLEPRQVGRPAALVSPEQQQIEDLTAQIGQLQIQLQAARVREELALAGLIPNKPRTRNASSNGATSSPDTPREPVGSVPANAGTGPAGTPDLKKTNQSPTG
jgi:hypothetical protein